MPLRFSVTVVAPREGAWIEMMPRATTLARAVVAPREGAWIEIPTSVRAAQAFHVAPREGAWIEIHLLYNFPRQTESRAP